ncbi:MAG: type II toxin-antitoxin system Phd/YefM family antitoxin, partial [Parcubacteria group bacterium]|nr:type II toxin-antitoxin system Phd/YefM family antitoxin [Parcubacteria group bacterium]
LEKILKKHFLFVRIEVVKPEDEYHLFVKASPMEVEAIAKFLLQDQIVDDNFEGFPVMLASLEDDIYDVSLTKANRNLGKIVDLVGGEENRTAVILTRKSTRDAVIVGIDWYCHLIESLNVLLFSLENPEAYIESQKANRDDILNAIKPDDEGSDDPERMLRAREGLAKKLEKYYWFCGVESDGTYLVVLMTTILAGALAFVPKTVEVDGFEFVVKHRVVEALSKEKAKKLLEEVREAKRRFKMLFQDRWGVVTSFRGQGQTYVLTARSPTKLSDEFKRAMPETFMGFEIEIVEVAC